MGDVKFRLGDMGEAEQAYISAIQIDSKNVKSYVGLAHLYSAYSLYGHAYAALKRAHDLAPNDGDVQLLWLATLPRRERVAALKSYLGVSHPLTEGDREGLQHYLAYLEITADQSAHSCKLVNDAEHTDTKLEFVHAPYPHITGVGLDVRINGRTHFLLLDSGASGITISRKSAQKAGLKRISDITIYGVGDKGARSGYLALADRIVVGGLEFHDCVVTVSDKKLVDINLPQKMLRLSTLPNRPGETTASTALNSEDEAEDEPANIEVLRASTNESFQVPKDRYIAPEMASWTRFFRFGHIILVETRLNDSKPMLFMIDSGAEGNFCSTKAARSVTKVHPNTGVEIAGANGRVDEVYRAEKVNIQFGRFHQQNQNVLTIDLSNLSQSVGTEISGMLGFNLLSILEVKIDYRDGLVDLAYKGH
jgi:hypothetical protein